MRNAIGNLAAVAAFVAVSAAARADDIPVFNTGVNDGHLVLTPGVADPHYSIIQVAAGSPFSVPRQATVARPHPVYLANSPIGTAGSSWIAPLIDASTSYAQGTYVYRTTFDLAGLDPTTAVLDGTVAVDDSVTDLRLNGASLGSLGGTYTSFAVTFHIDHGFQEGVNTLDFKVLNAGGSASPMGLRVVVHGTAASAVPVDAQPPVIVGCYDRSISWQGAQITLVAASLGITAVDDVDGSVPVALSPNAVGLGAHVVTASAHDAAGNTATCTFTVTVVDVTAPVIAGPSSSVPTFEWHGSPVTLTPSLLGLSATDDVDGTVAVTLSPAVAGLGSTSVTARAADAAGNVATRSFTVRVLDVTAPVIAGPSSSTPTFEWHGSAIALTPALLGLSATDDVDGDVLVTLSPAVAGLGSTSVTARAADAAGNVATRSFTVSVLDVTAPVITGPSSSTPTFEWRGSAIALTPALLGLSATDDVDGSVAVTLTPGTAGMGDQVVSAAATDAAGNSATRSFTVHVADTTAPVFVSLHASPDVLDTRDHSMAQITICASVADEGDASPRVRIVSVQCVDGDLTSAAALSAADWNVTGALTADLRCERSGRGDGRTYVITVACTDASGNTATATVNVFVPHDNGRRSSK